MATVYLPRSLAQFVDGAEAVTVDAPRVRELLQALATRFPALVTPLETMSIAVDGEIHQHPDYLKLSDQSEIHLVPRISGG